jgi:hypothetical protein
VSFYRKLRAFHATKDLEPAKKQAFLPVNRQQLMACNLLEKRGFLTFLGQLYTS